MSRILLTALLALALAGPARGDEARPARNDAELKAWLQNMAWHHRYSMAEMAEVLGLKPDAVEAALKKFAISAATRPRRPAGAPLLVLPYPGGRHPRIGFLDGAVRPQRETKVSIFTPWDEASYVVADVPEAIWSNLGLTYLAHTHIDTIWTKEKTALKRLEWQRQPDGALVCERTLPNGIVFGTRVEPGRDAVRFEMWLTNGTKRTLTDLRVQNCVMLKGAAGFTEQTNKNKVFSGAYAAARSADGTRWVITAWAPIHRAWGNEKCPCLHADPKFPDCPPGQTRRLRGWLSFYQGTDLKAELARIEATGWSKVQRVSGEVVDADSGARLAARVYVQDAKGGWHFPRSDDAAGSAVAYQKRSGANARSVEMHTTLSAHPFALDLPPGRYTVTVERGKEYLPLVREVAVSDRPVSVTLRLRRWADMARRSWYSGETHVHRALDELPNVVLAEDLNVALPLLHWVTEAFEPPRSTRGAPAPKVEPRVIEVDRTHVIYPRNTEYEIFTVGKKAHTLGAFFILNHRTVFDRGVPPVRPVVAQARREGGLIELDKHNWPWSMALVPLIKPDLFELANNHVWRTEFGFATFGEPAPAYMKVERDARGFTERGWIDYGFQNYYALLNCGYRLRPTAGTASGVHPVPLGFGRVYVHCPEGFSYAAWMKGLDAGRSFVTTGPMLLVEVNGQPAGHTFKQAKAGAYTVKGVAESAVPLSRIEIVVNGEVARTLRPANRRAKGGGYESAVDEAVKVEGSSWLAVRCYEERADKRVRFAHSSPVHIDIAGRPLRPRGEEIDWLVKRVEGQIARSKGVLPKAAVEEYEEALKAYREIARAARR